jgi:tetratricopeptide (TPR) repeat protein
MTGRDGALAAVRSYVVPALTGASPPSGLLSDAALRVADDLRSAGNPAEDRDIAYTLGMFHWCRYLAASGHDRDAEDREGRDAAVRFLAMVGEGGDVPVSTAVRSLIRSPGGPLPEIDVETAVCYAVHLHNSCADSGDRSLLNDAALIFRAAIEATPPDRPQHLHLARFLATTVQTLDDPTEYLPALEEAVRAGQAAVADIPADRPDRLERLSPLREVLRTLGEITHTTTALEQLVQVDREFAACCPADHPLYLASLISLAYDLKALGDATEDTALLEEAVQAADRALMAMPAEHPLRPGLLSILSGSLLSLGRRTGDVRLLQRAAQADREAVATADAASPLYAEHLHDLSATLFELAVRSQDTTTLREALQTERDAIAALPPDAPVRAEFLSSLRSLLVHAFRETADTALLEEAARIAEEAAAATRPDDPTGIMRVISLVETLQLLREHTTDPAALKRLAGMLSELGSLLRGLGERSENPAILEVSAAATRSAIAAVPDDPSGQAVLRDNLVAALIALNSLRKDQALIEEALQLARTALAAGSAGSAADASHIRRLNNLAGALRVGGGREDVAMLRELTRVGSELVAALPADAPERAMALQMLATDLRALARATGETAPLEQAVRAGYDAVAALPDRDPSRISALRDLRRDLERLADRTGDPAALEQAVSVAREAVAACPDGHPLRALYLTALAWDLQSLWELTDDTGLLEEAVEAGRSAVAATPADDEDRAERIRLLSVLVTGLYERTWDVVDADEVVAVARAAFEAGADDATDRGRYFNALSSAYRAIYLRTRDRSALDQAIQAAASAVASTAPGRPGRAGFLNSLSIVYQDRAKLGDDLAALEQAIDAGREAITATAADDPNLPTYVNNVGISLLARYVLADAPDALDALDEALAVTRRALAAVPPGERDSTILSNLGNILYVRGGRTGDIPMLEEAVDVCQDAVDCLPAGHPQRPSRLANLSRALTTLSGRTGDIAVEEKALQAVGDAVALLPRDNPDRALLLVNQITLLVNLSYRKSDTAGLAAAARLAREGLAAAADDGSMLVADTARAIALQALGRRTQDRATLDEAVQASAAALARLTADDPRYEILLTGRAGILLSLYQVTGEADVLDECLRAGREVAAREDRSAFGMHVLHIALRESYESTGDKPALIEAAAAGRQAVALGSPAGPARSASHGQTDHVTALTSLATTLRYLSSQSGELAYLEEAAQVGRDAVAGIPAPADGTADGFRAAALNNLGSVLMSLGDRTGDSTVLRESARAHREAVAISPADTLDRAKRLSNLGGALLSLYERTDDQAVLDEAVQVSRDAVSATPPDHPSLPRSLNNLATVLRAWSGRSDGSDGSDGSEHASALEEAVAAQRRAIATTQPGNTNRTMYLCNLSALLSELGRRTVGQGTLEEAVQVARESVAVSDEGPDEAMCLYRLGNALLAFGAATSHSTSVAEANECMAKVADNLSVPPYLRLQACQVMAQIPDLAGSTPQDRLAAMEAAADLLPQLAPRTLNRADREYSVGRLTSIAAQAAAAACEAGQSVRAAELLEQTRGILVADTLDARSSDLTRLRARRPDLAAEFERLRDLLEALSQGDGDMFQSEDDAFRRGDDGAGVGVSGGGDGSAAGSGAWWSLVEERREAEAAWRRLIERIRAIDEFSDFLARPDVRTLTASASSDGPVVFVYAGEQRSDALILSDDADNPVRPVPLPALTEAAALEQVERLLRARADTENGALPPEERIAAQRQILEILAWMWDAITGPVLDALELSDEPADSEPWPHIWWCPVGVLAFLPLHASGHHAEADRREDRSRGPRTALDRVVSSYFTTLRGLAYSRAQRSGAEGTVIVAVPDAPEARPLAANEEAEGLAGLIPGARILAHPTRADVLAAIPDHRIAHFACHGYANWDDPASSRLVLHDHLTDPLTVADISRLQLLSGLAYLSACDTAVTSFRLANEAVHITGAFHLSGYQHVIGTLWRIDDPTSGAVAVDFYKFLTSDGTVPPATQRTADALHRAVRRVRDQYPRTPTLWAAYVHTGS